MIKSSHRGFISLSISSWLLRLYLNVTSAVFVTEQGLLSAEQLKTMRNIFKSKKQDNNGKNPTPEYDPKDLDEAAMYDAFKKFDINNDGVIDKQELKQLLTTHLKLKEPPTDKQISRIMIKVDLDNDGVISFDEFKKMMGQTVQTKNKYLAMFTEFDKDNDGYITRDELAQSMKEVHDDVTDEEIDSMMKSLDKSK